MKIKILIAVFIFCSLLLVIGGSSVISKAADSEGDLPSATSPPVNLPLVVNNFGGDFWSLSGNAGTNPGEHFLGTIDDKEVQIKTKNINRMTVGANGVRIFDNLEVDKSLFVLGGLCVTPGIYCYFKADESGMESYVPAVFYNNVDINGIGDDLGNLRIINGGVCIDSDGCVSAGPGSLRVGSGGIHGTDTSNKNLYLLPANDGNVAIGYPSNYNPMHKLEVNGTTMLKDTVIYGEALIVKAQIVTDLTANRVIITGGSDLAEPFLIHAQTEVLPGMVVAIDPEHPGDLRLAGQAYDSTVAGCLSGGGELEPGLVLQGEALADTEALPVALTGRVYCWADASEAPIQPGDLLTTSSRPGYAMKAADPAQAWGAILGKAMTALEDGQGLVLVLVSLQ